MTIHDAYAGNAPAVPFSGTRDDLRGGEYLGPYIPIGLFTAGDIVTAAGDSTYFYDPELRIEGVSYAWGGNAWRRVELSADTADAPAPPAPRPCLDRHEKPGTSFPCSFCLGDERIMAQGLCLHEPDYVEPA